jgi:hypothetical protein
MQGAPPSTRTYRTNYNERAYVAVPGHVPSPTDGRTPYACEGPGDEEKGCTRDVIPGRDGVRCTDGTILCTACDAILDNVPIGSGKEQVAIRITIALDLVSTQAEADSIVSIIDDLLDEGLLQDAVSTRSADRGDGAIEFASASVSGAQEVPAVDTCSKCGAEYPTGTECPDHAVNAGAE